MKYTKQILFAAITAILLHPLSASAQIGPDLKPPGLDENHPIDSYTRLGKSFSGEDWRHETSWELNASDIVFSAAKKRQLISEAPSTIHIITDRDIAAYGWRSLAEILRHVPGVQTLTTKSSFQSVMIRGLVGTEDNNSRILWLQNGVPMNDVRDSGIWLDETYPVELIKRIEVVLGPGSALYGSGAFQGVINIFTKDPSDINKYGEYRVALQNNMTFKASAIAAYTSEDGKLGILGHVAGNTTQGSGLIGDFVYTNYSMAQAGDNLTNNGNALDFRGESLKSNSDKHWYNINFKLNYEQIKWELGFTDIYAGADGNESVPNIDYATIHYNDKLNGGYVSPDQVEAAGEDYLDADRYPYRFNRREFYTDLIYEDNFGESINFLALLSYRLNYYEHKHYRNYKDAEEVKEFFNVYNQDDSDGIISSYANKVNYNTLQHKLYALTQVQWHIYDANELIAGLVFEYQYIRSDDFMNGKGYPDIKNSAGENIMLDATKLGQLTPSIFIQDEQRFWNDRIILTAGARFDAYRIYGSGDKAPDYAPSWRFAFLAKWTDWMTMRLSYGYSFKEPSLYQLYIDTFDAVGNPELDPETLHNIELSFLFTPTYFMKIRLDTFATFIDNLIVMQYDKFKNISALGEDGRYTPVQDGGAKLFGFEIGLDTAIGMNWNLYTHYNFLYSISDYKEVNKSDRIPDDAMHRFKVGATYRNDMFTADLAMFLVGGTPSTASDMAWDSRSEYATPFYAIFQPQFSVNVGANIGLSVQGSYAFSEGFASSPTHAYYYEKEGVPVSRYNVMFSAFYPFKK